MACKLGVRRSDNVEEHPLPNGEISDMSFFLEIETQRKSITWVERNEQVERVLASER